MSNNLTPESLAAREQQLIKREQALAKREIILDPKARLVVTIAAQVGGLLLLFILGSGTFPIDNPDIAHGLNFIRTMTWVYLCVTLIVPAAVLLYALVCVQCEPFDDFYINLILLTFVAADLVILSLLVCQEGGLCRSMFLPIYFLISVAYLAAEEPEHRGRKLLVLSSIVVCIFIAYLVSRWTMPPPTNNDSQPALDFTFSRWKIRVTDFSTLSHPSYDEAVLYASLVSAFVPIIQISLVSCIEKYRDIKAVSQRAAGEGNPAD